MVFGISEIEKFDNRRVEAFLKESQRKVPCTQLVAAVAQVDSFIRFDSDTTMMQHRAQPVQVLFFDGDSLIFYHINCYTQSGFLAYDWNNYGSFDRFPPSPNVIEDLCGSMTLPRFRALFPEVEVNTRYTVIILWSNVLRKISRGAVSAVSECITGCDDCTVILVNTDKWYVDYLHRQE